MSVPTVQPKRESGDERKLAIALAARALIVEKGLEGLRTRDIALRVGINIATLHYHVPSKGALIELVTETIRSEFRAQALTRPRAHLSPAQQLEHEFFDYHELFSQNRALLAVLSELTERARRDQAISAIVLPMQTRWRDMIAAILGAGVADGSFRPDLDPEPAAQMLIGALIGFGRALDTSPAAFDRLRAELRRAVANPFAAGLAHDR